ncbi:MAG: TetR/AcrR family transcriptional regulator [Frankia sp.]|nr:TetR/AcrR family transcriptional regulator [Frankia sp.]
MAARVRPRVRRSADDRRDELISIGLALLSTRPIYDVTVDEVARIAGISRSLLFHYFPTKRDYYAAVVRAAANALLSAAVPDDPDDPVDGQVRSMVSGYIRFVAHNGQPYVALLRGAGSENDWLRTLHNETREVLAERYLAAVGPDEADLPRLRALTRAWLAFVEELTLEWNETRFVSEADLLDLIVDAQHSTLRLAQRRLARRHREPERRALAAAS